MRTWLLALGCLLLTHNVWGTNTPKHYTTPLPYGDMDQWLVRYITESKIMGGKTKTLYAVAPTDTIRVNHPYYPLADNPWGSSATYAKFMGIETGMAESVVPEPRGNGYCCRLRNVLTDINLFEMYAMVSGTIYMGRALEPLSVTAKSKPYTAIDFGVPFKEHPVALMLDYKAYISPADSLITTERNKPELVPGHDCAVIYIYLQHRWEDKETGKIYARRVGTAYERICETIPEWVNNHVIPIRWGNITKQDNFYEYEGLNQMDMMTRNSKGKMVKIEEVGWSLDEPTHIIIYISASNAGVFRACEGNTLWVDNLRFVYEEEE